MKTAFQVLLTIAVIVLGYLIVESVNKPVRFQQAYEARTDKVVERLIDIRTAQVAFRSVNNRFTGSFDTLLHFVREDSLPLVRMEGSLTDSMLMAGMTELMALDMGIIRRDTIRVSVKDSLFGNRPWVVDSLMLIPFTDNKVFEMGAGSIRTASGVDVPVFQVQVHNNTFLEGLDRQEIININDRLRDLERFPGLQVGSLTQANNSAGNWE